MSAVQGVQGGHIEPLWSEPKEVIEQPLHTLHTPAQTNPELQLFIQAHKAYQEAHRIYQAALLIRCQEVEAQLSASDVKVTT